MTMQYVPDAAADLRWRNWVARGASNDRRTNSRITALMLLIAIGFGIWAFVTMVVR
jgi:hypothetical protein